MSTENNNDDFLAHLRILNQIGASILSGQTIGQIIDTVYHHVNMLMDAYSFAIGIYNKNTGQIEYTGARENDKLLPFFSIDAHSPARFSEWAFANQLPILINNFDEEYKLYLPKLIAPMQGIEPASLMYVPLIINKEMVGLFSVRTQEKNAYSLHSLEILKTLSVFIAKGFENTHTGASQNVAKKQPPKSYHLNPLSARELEVLNLLSKGFTNRNIASELFISPSTVKTHTLNIYEKLEAANRTQAIVKAKEYGLIV